MKVVVFLRVRATEWRMLRMICGVMLNDRVESTVITLRVEMNDLDEHLRQKRLKWFRHIARRGGGDKVLMLKIEGQRKRGRASEAID